MFHMRNIIGKKVKEARKAGGKRITQADLVARLQLLGWQIDRSGVAKIEIGMREVTDIEIVMLAKALGVKASWLLGEEK